MHILLKLNCEVINTEFEWDEEKEIKLTEEDKKMLEEARKHPIVYDEDSPELTPEMEKAFRLAAKTRNRLRA
ncbi:MAG: hypothetical protein NC433_01555 [Clostridiales bacterium]|nr:hypothetical protein [Clostridiales bacterium]